MSTEMDMSELWTEAEWARAIPEGAGAAGEDPLPPAALRLEGGRVTVGGRAPFGPREEAACLAARSLLMEVRRRDRRSGAYTALSRRLRGALEELELGLKLAGDLDSGREAALLAENRRLEGELAGWRLAGAAARALLESASGPSFGRASVDYNHLERLALALGGWAAHPERTKGGKAT